ncbi:hypothetical protein BDV97DRAFT_352058, partial [Delphinella strobiligena]
QRLVEIEGQLAEARQILPDFGPEKIKLQEKAARDLREYKLTVSKQAQANYSKHSGEMRQAQKLKEVAEKQLAIITSELEPVKAENQLLKEQAKDKLANDRTKLQAAELESEVSQRRQLHIEAAAYRETIQTLQGDLTGCQAAQSQGEAEVQRKGEEVRRLQQDYQNIRKQISESEACRKEIEGRLEEAKERARHVETASCEQAERHESELSSARGTIEEERSRRKTIEDLCARLQKSVDAQAQNRHNVAVQTKDSQLQRMGALQSSELFGSAPTTQDLARLDEPQQQQNLDIRPRKGLKKIDRNLYADTQPSRRSQTTSPPQSEALIQEGEREIPGSQLSEYDLLDNRNPNSQSSHASGFDLSAISNQILDSNGVREVGSQTSQKIEDIQSQSRSVRRNHGASTTRLAESVEDDRPQLEPFSRLNSRMDMETQSHSSSPLSPSKSSYSNFAQILAEESQSNLRLATSGSQKNSNRIEGLDEQRWTQAGPRASIRPTQGTDMSAPPHRSVSISQGKKRDPQHHTEPKPSQQHMPLAMKSSNKSASSQRKSQRSSSPAFMNVESNAKPTSSRDKHASKSSAPESWDVYDMDSSPVGQGRKRPHINAESGASKKARPTPSPAIPRPGSQHSRTTSLSQSGSTTKGASSLTRHTTVVKQTKTVRSSSNASGSSHRTRSSKQNPKFAERFNQI